MDYALSEVETNVGFVSAESIFKQTYRISVGPASASPVIEDLNIDGDFQVIAHECWLRESSGIQVQVPYVNELSGAIISLLLTSTLLVMTSNTDFSSYSGFLTIYYYKL